jgi:cytochrome c5
VTFLFSRLTKLITLFGLFLATLVIIGCEQKPKLGEITYQGTCVNCHALGINGAPILGNKKMWGKRIPQGLPTLVEHASNGYGLMPAKGGNDALTEKEMQAAIEYMIAQVKD